ncbi:hypothetical protein PRZ48_007741 [Zasmidium cellare]|uniref:Uncharacterized protein n=1 Tax=Zasmidium cellare TaxID=395010 RepID=A0ABR0EK52_ZASCE|nr:hypothetical protein PRZ48_007741 [Zasmidium cellare]
MVEGVTRWRELLHSGNHFSHVKTIRVIPEEVFPPLIHLVECGDHIYDKWQYLPIGVDPEQAADGRGWNALARLMGDLPALVDFVYAGRQQLDPSILEILQTTQTGCRLHLESFSLRGLILAPGKPVVVDTFEKNLATTRNLYSLVLSRFDEYDSDGGTDYNLKAVLDMVKGNENLKEVSVLRELPGSSPMLLGAVHQPRYAWQGTELTTRPSCSKGTLTSLELAGIHTGAVQSLRFWSEATDFRHLRTLNLHSGVTQDALTFLSANHNMPSLENLVLDLEGQQRDSISGEMRLAVRDFFWNLNPLSTLKLTGVFDEHDVDGILARHGQQLRYLAVFPDVFSAAKMSNIVSLIGSHCTMLEDLAVPVPRTVGSETEVFTYKSLGQIPNLRSIFLSLDCKFRMSTAERNLSTEDERIFPALGGNTTLRNIDVRDMLINHAFDQDLARAIFETITAGTSASRSRLEKLELKIQSVKTNFSYPMSLQDVCGQLEGSWTLIRSPRDDRPNEIIATWKPEPSISRNLGKDIEPVFRSLWPKKSDHWMQDWHSFPLCEPRDC